MYVCMYMYIFVCIQMYMYAANGNVPRVCLQCAYANVDLTHRCTYTYTYRHLPYVKVTDDAAGRA